MSLGNERLMRSSRTRGRAPLLLCGAIGFFPWACSQGNTAAVPQDGVNAPPGEAAAPPVIADDLLVVEPGGDGGAALPAEGDSPEDFDYHYGVYLNGSKVGWMRSQMRTHDGAHHLSVALNGAIRGLGKVSKIQLQEERSFWQKDGRLRHVAFSQTAATGTTRTSGRVTAGRLRLKIESGSAVTEEMFTVTDTLASELATSRLARAGTVGATAQSQRFDAGVMRSLTIDHKVLALQRKMFAGVVTEMIQIESTHVELGIVENGWFDRSGKMLEAKIGGFFVARFEAPSVAKKLDYSQDLLVSAVVKPTKAITAAETLQRMTVRFTGFDAAPPPSSVRQQVKKETETTLLILTKDRAPEIPYPLSPTPAAAAELRPTPFIQSEHQDIKRTAAEVVGDATDLYTASSRLSHYVYKHVRDEYVPAYSNALEAWSSGRGDCTEHSVLFVALARAAGIPARVAVGIAYWKAGNGFGWHAWAEVGDGRGGWYSVDPTWDQPIADVTHIKLAGGGPAEQARIVMLLGRLKITEMQL